VPFSLLGHHRSGTSFINDLVRTHPSVTSISEPLSQHLDLFRRPFSAHWPANSCADTCSHPSIAPGGETEVYLQELRRWLWAPGRVHGFKETALFEQTPWLYRLLGLLPTILIVRDPRAVVSSIVRRGLHKTYWDYKQRLHVYSCQSANFLDLNDYSDPIVLAATYWTMSMSLALQQSKEYGWIIVRLEDVIQNPTIWLPRIMNAIGVDVHSTQWDFLYDAWQETRGAAHSHHRATHDVLDSWKEVLSNEDQRTVVSIAREAMAQLRYDSEPCTDDVGC